MKKLFVLFASFALIFVLAACGGETGDYEPGVYFGYTDGNQNTFAVVTIDENGFISEILVDTVYLKVVDDGPVTWLDRNDNPVDGIATTKRSLDGGCGYNMWPGQPVEDCKVEGQIMWHDQVDLVAADVIENQGVPTYDLDGAYFDEDGVDTVAGVTIRVTAYISAIENALDQARK